MDDMIRVQVESVEYDGGTVAVGSGYTAAGERVVFAGEPRMLHANRRSTSLRRRTGRGRGPDAGHPRERGRSMKPEPRCRWCGHLYRWHAPGPCTRCDCAKWGQPPR
jgi:hypothetical protein